ncbi:3-deoxy-D-manno-octulosonic acid transferase, partial [bacterium]|nr:3-deoxy-D-manno-octulosonic acid transferase [bacterium]
MMHRIYNLLLSLAWPLLFLHFLRGKYILKKYKKPLSKRMGWISIQCPPQQKRILIHAVSVGETVASQPFVLALKKQFPKHHIVFSNVTETGHQRAQEIIPADDFVFFPLDYQDSVARFLKKINPEMVFIVETEIWPNFLCECKRREIKTNFINGRISKKSFERYGLFKDYFAELIQDSNFYMQSKIDLQRIQALGASKAINAGNLKYDQLSLNLESG